MSIHTKRLACMVERMTSNIIRAYKTCIGCKHQYKVPDAFSDSICPACNTINERILDFFMYCMNRVRHKA